MNKRNDLSGFPPLHARDRDYRLITFILLLVMLALLLFYPAAVIGIRFDEAKYLGLARDFPSHRLYNNELYLMHGPGYPALIRLGMILLPDHAAAIGVSIVMSVVTFWAIGSVGRVLRLDRTGVLLARMFLVLQPNHTIYGQEISKESLMVALYALLLGGFMSAICGSRRGRWLAAIAGGYFGLTADQHVPLVLISLALVRAAWPQRTRRLGLVILLPMLATWLGTVAVRMARFATGPFVPIGMDGIPEEADRLGLLQAIIPNTAPQTRNLVKFNDIWSNLANAGSFIQEFFLMQRMPYGIYLWHGVLCLLVVLGAVRICLFENTRRRWLGWGLILAAVVLFGVPLLTKPMARYALPSLVPMAGLFAMNGRWFGGKWIRGRPAWWAIAAGTLLAGTLVFVTYGKRYLILKRPLVVEANVVARLIKIRATGGIMTQIGYSPELAYLTDRRVLALPDDPTLLKQAIRHYDISHIVLGSGYGGRWDSTNRADLMNAVTIDFILEHPFVFKPVAHPFQPQYPGCPHDEFIIFEVDRSWRHDE